MAAPEDIEVTEARVTYTTKELLKRIDDRFERLESMVTGAPTRGEFDHVDARVTALEEEAVHLRITAAALAADKKQRWTRNEKMAGATFATVNIAINLLILHFSTGVI